MKTHVRIIRPRLGDGFEVEHEGLAGGRGRWFAVDKGTMQLGRAHDCAISDV